MADDDMGSAFLKNHMQENQSGAFKVNNAGGTPGTDDYYERRYQKPVDLSDAEPQTVNRRGKGGKR